MSYSKTKVTHKVRVLSAKRRPIENFKEPTLAQKAQTNRLDTDVPWVLDRDELKSKCRNTPFDEARMQGRAVRTIVAGRTVYEYV